MKKTDFDTIQEKLNTSLNAPEQVDKDYILQQLEGVEPAAQSNIVPLPAKRRKKRTISAIAAAVAVVLIGAIGIGVIPNIPKNDVLATTAGSKQEALSAYSNYRQVKKDIKKLSSHSTGFFPFSLSKDEPETYVVEESAAADSATTTGETSFGTTFNQVEGVDEEDMIQTDGKYIYYAGATIVTGYDSTVNVETAETQHHSVYIFSAKGKHSAPVQTIDLGGDDCYIEGIYVRAGKLIVLYTQESVTCTAIYDVSDMQNIQKTAFFSQSGSYSASRLIGNKLYLVSNQIEKKIPHVCCGDAEQKIPAEQIYKTASPASATFLVVSCIDITNSEKMEQAKAVLGGSRSVYCNQEHMFVLADIVNNDEGEYLKREYRSRSQIFKIDLNGEIAFTAAAEIEGTAKNQYALDEYNGVFRVAVTNTSYGNETNCLYTFDENLKRLGKVESFAEGEHIEAVKFLGDTAYVITYETTDPLFVIDLSDPAKPAILGSVKISGFSTTLIPVEDNLVLGVGIADSDSTTGMRNLKLVLFDIGDKTRPKVIDEVVYQYVSSGAMHDTKEILRNTQRNNFTVYATYAQDITKKHNDEPGNEYDYYDYKTAYGSLTFAVKNGHIVTEQQYRSDTLSDSYGRCTYIGDTIYMVDAKLHFDSTLYK
ncbi:MAG: beta-propeller domain-containing protein [Clostridia bacterium]|nr:beta-propeller domain-containing protein [Clostridia bacterium]